ncbi:MAG: type 1 glutamine amidotransferase [Candidatus Nitrospinota bacterium M3_3B_026]
MRALVLQHVPFEDAADIGAWLAAMRARIKTVRLYEGAPLPGPDQFDLLVVMGGPMSVNDEKIYPWLADEKRLIEKSLRAGKKILGVCLGAQLLASALGARVYKNREKEIGWFPVELAPQAAGSALFAGVPERFMAFHWHGETFDIPSGAAWLARSAACERQAFEYGGAALGLQFHLESTRGSVEKLVKNLSSDITPGKYVQDARTMLEARENFESAAKTLDVILSNLVSP